MSREGWSLSRPPLPRTELLHLEGVVERVRPDQAGTDRIDAHHLSTVAGGDEPTGGLATGTGQEMIPDLEVRLLALAGHWHACAGVELLLGDCARDDLDRVRTRAVAQEEASIAHLHALPAGDQVDPVAWIEQPFRAVVSRLRDEVQHLVQGLVVAQVEGAPAAGQLDRELGDSLRQGLRPVLVVDGGREDSFLLVEELAEPGGCLVGRSALQAVHRVGRRHHDVVAAVRQRGAGEDACRQDEPDDECDESLQETHLLSVVELYSVREYIKKAVKALFDVSEPILY